MGQDSDLDIFDEITQADHPTPGTVEIDTETRENALEFNVSLLDREERWNKMSRLPDGLFEGDSDDVTTSSGKIPDGDGAKAMEEVFVKSLSHPEFVDEELEMLVDEIQDEVLFEISITIIDKSMKLGEVTGFRFNQ